MGVLKLSTYLNLRPLATGLRGAYRILATVLILTTAVACSSRRTVELLEARAVGDGSRLLVGVDSCGGDPVTIVEETASTVRVQVQATVSRGTGPACMDVAELLLREPLADRLLIDEATGDGVSVIDLSIDSS